MASTALTLASRGCTDALCLHRLPHYAACWQPVLAAVTLNAALGFFVTAWQAAHGVDAATRPPWGRPAFLVVVILSARLNAATAATALDARRGGPPSPLPRGQRALVRPPTLRRPADAAAFRGLVTGAAFAQAAATQLLLTLIHPTLATVAGFVATAAAYALCLFDAPFTAARAPLSARLASLESAWPYYLAFGAVAAAPGTALASRPWLASAAAACTYPVFSVLAVDARGVPPIARGRSGRGHNSIGRVPVLAPAVAAVSAVVGTRALGPLVLRVAGGRPPPAKPVKKKV